MTSDAPTPIPVPPGTEGASKVLAIGSAGMIAGLVLNAAAFGVDAESAGWVFLVVVGSALFFIGFFAANAGLQRLRARRGAVRTGPHDWAGVVVLPPLFISLRLFAVNDLGSHLYSLSGRHLLTWRWKDTTKAVGLPVEVRGRARPGLTLEGTHGGTVAWTVAMGFPGPYGFGSSQETADAALAAVRRRMGSS
jgi:amino acid transporter